MKKALKIFGGILLSLFIIGTLMKGCDKETSNSSTSATVNNNTTSKSWQTVNSLSGTGMKQSQNFTLTGGEAKIKYKYTSNSKQIGMLAVYVFDKGHDFSKEGGIPDVMINASEEGESYITKPAGEYYIYVNAAGKWDVVVEEKK